MAIECEPSSPLSKDHIPENSESYRVQDGDNWINVAEKFNMIPLQLIHFNYNTIDPPEVNWYLNRNVGCVKETRDGYNWRFSSSAYPGKIYIPKTVVNFPPDTIVVQNWQKISFWLELNYWDIRIYKKIRGDLCMRINHHPYDWYAWSISASFLCGNIPIKGSPPIGLGKINSTEKTFEYNPQLFDPINDWHNKGVSVQLVGSVAYIQVKNAFPKTPNKDYEPIKGIASKWLKFDVVLDSPQLGGCAGIGGIEDGRNVKPIPRQPSNPMDTLEPKLPGNPPWIL